MLGGIFRTPLNLLDEFLGFFEPSPCCFAVMFNRLNLVTALNCLNDFFRNGIIWVELNARIL